MSDLVVLGGGESGVGAAIAGKHLGYRVFVSDASSMADNYINRLTEQEIEFEQGGHDKLRILAADLVVKSPGIPDGIPLIKELYDKGVQVISEIEFGARNCAAKLIGITGSNGKTTTTSLVYHILKKAGQNIGLAGNIGKSFAEQVVSETYDSYVLELSSFQLDGIDEFCPQIGMLLNISPDHLDRYDYDFQKYIDSKFRLTMNQSEKDYLIYDGDDPVIETYLNTNNHQIKAQLLPFSLEREFSPGAYVKNDKIHIDMNQDKFTMEIEKLAMQGRHNTKNMMAAAMAAKLMKVRNKDLMESLEDFEGVEHRLEKFLKINGVQYINDSKATNVNATFYALECMEEPTVWIVGGVDKGNDYTELMPLVRSKVKGIVCLGLDNEKIIETFNGLVPLIVETAGAEEAAKVAYKIAEKGDAVLLSPACASFDLFKSYEDRGQQFKDAVRKL